MIDGAGDVPRCGFGTVPLGWTRTGWIERLRALIVRCQSAHPDQADVYRRWVASLERKGDYDDA